jgi:hypothetical protein
MVAVTWALAFAWAAGSSVTPSVLLQIACGTWIIYVIDRILDTHRATRLGDMAVLHERHFFHWRHRNKFIPIAVLTGTATAITVLALLPHAALAFDCSIAIAALLYISCVHLQIRVPSWFSRIASKESAVGVLFTAGCAAPGLSEIHLEDALTLWPVLAGVSFFALLASLNCTAIQRWESGRDGIQIRASLTCAIGLILALSLFSKETRVSGLIYSGTTSTLLLLLLDGNRHRFSPLLLRALADLVLFTPAVLLIFNWLPK